MKSSFLQQVMESIDPPAELISEDIILWKRRNFPFTYYVKFFSEVACKVNVKGEHDTNLIIAFLNEFSSEDLLNTSESNPLYLSKSSSLEQTPFDRRAIVHPSVSTGSLGAATGFMASQTYTVYPVYKCEFNKEDTRDEILYRMSKVISWSDWNRSPSPALSVRFLRIETGVKSTGGKRMVIFSLTKVEKIISHVIKEEGFIDIENFERRLVHIEISNNSCEVILEGERWAQDVNTLISWLHIFAIEGVEKSKRAINLV